MTEDRAYFEQLLKETKSKARRAILNSGAVVTPRTLETLMDIMENSIRTWKIEMDLSIPRKTPSLNQIHIDGKKVIGYHPVDGVWRMICQVTRGDKVHYYTDSVEERPISPR